MSHTALLEAGELVSCPQCGVLGGERCIYGENKKKIDPKTARGPHPARVAVARAAGLLKKGPGNSGLVLNRHLTDEQQDHLDELSIGGAAVARAFMADEDARTFRSRARRIAASVREKWLEKLKNPKHGRGLRKM